MELEVREGDIAEVEADAIANAANDHLWMGAGVAGALKRAGGDEIEHEAMAQGPIELGTAVATAAGRLLPRRCRRARLPLARAAGVRDGSRRLPARRVRSDHGRRGAGLRAAVARIRAFRCSRTGRRGRIPSGFGGLKSPNRGHTPG